MIAESGKLKVYLIGYNTFGITRDSLTGFLDTRPEIHNWYSLLPGQLFVVSQDQAGTLAELLRGRFPNQFLVITQIFGNSADGWLPKEAWEFINNPVSNRSSGLASLLMTQPPTGKSPLQLFLEMIPPPDDPRKK